MSHAVTRYSCVTSQPMPCWWGFMSQRWDCRAAPADLGSWQAEESTAQQHQRQALAWTISFTQAFLLKQHSDWTWLDEVQYRKGKNGLLPRPRQCKLNHSHIPLWLDFAHAKTTHSGGLAMYLCQNRDSVNEKSLRTSPVMSCGWIRCGALYWLPSRGPGMNSLIIFGWCGCAFYSMVRKASLGYTVACQIHWPTLLVLTCMSFFVSVVLPITSWFGKQEFFYTTFA